MTIACVVLDFDGTLTDVAREAPPFEAAYAAHLADLLGRELGAGWPEALAEARRRAPELGWTIEGPAVAPADADPYILTGAAVQIFLDGLGVMVKDRGFRDAVIQAIFVRAYQRTEAAFRPEAREVVEGLIGRGVAVYVVTNATTSVVERKLGEVVPASRGVVRVIGDARKFAIGPDAGGDPRFGGLAREKRVAGLGRPVLLGRGRYFDALRRVWEETGVGPAETLVCGDVYELDLALPAELGAEVHMISRESTHDYEREAVAALGPRGAMSDTLLPILGRVG
jgi:FMN phosphatase YigB (HAD superfamily)